MIDDIRRIAEALGMNTPIHTSDRLPDRWAWPDWGTCLLFNGRPQAGAYQFAAHAKAALAQRGIRIIPVVGPTCDGEGHWLTPFGFAGCENIYEPYDPNNPESELAALLRVIRMAPESET